MDGTNGSTQTHFVLLGFSDRPHLERILFVVILITYLLTLVGNTTIILVSRLDPHLHTPMYFFLTHLSFLDLSFTTNSIPQLLYNLNGSDKTISYTGCAIQLFLFLGLGGPLHYMVIMNPRLCRALVSVAWGCGVANSLAMSPVTLSLPRCGRHEVDHFLCEMPALIRTACVSTVAVKGTVFVLAVGVVLSPLVFILLSYSCIVRAHLRLPSHRGLLFLWKHHLHVHATRSQLLPGPGQVPHALLQHCHPLLNPLIDTLRNREVKGALGRLLLGKRELGKE
uniref:Olfactory receptor family 2 subfamily W member 3 n=1 Tax=Rhinopithecus roxellana TaxID=61622 RepID=A0A2K6P9R2_RHIRO